jgi:hypothetical protein
VVRFTSQPPYTPEKSLAPIELNWVVLRAGLDVLEKKKRDGKIKCKNKGLHNWLITYFKGLS